MKERIPAVRPTRAPEKQDDDDDEPAVAEADGFLPFCPKQKSIWRNKWKRKISCFLPLLISFLYQVDFLQSSSTVADNNNNNRDRQKNRQLLEHGLRGGDDTNQKEGPPPSDRTTSLIDSPTTTHNNNNSSSSSTSTKIPVSNITVPLYAHSGTHHVYVYIGSPPQRQTLIVDTGSRAMAVPCKTTNSDSHSDCCGVHASEYFDPAESTTHIVSTCGTTNCLLHGISECDENEQQQQRLLGTRKTPASDGLCTFSQKYTEGSSWTATEVEDLVWLGNQDASQSLEEFLPQLAVPYPFGCQTSSTGLFRNQYADGILGLSIHETSLVTSFYKEGLIPSNAFSLCFTHKAGVLSLGGTLDPSKYHRDRNGETAMMKTTPVVTNAHTPHGYYSVEVIRLVVGESIVVTDANTKPRLLRDMNAGNGCILDSGTTDSYFPASLARPVRRAVIGYGMTKGDQQTADAINQEHPSLVADASLDLFSSRLRQRDYTFEEFETLLPTITVVFANEVELKVSPQHYMEDVPMDEDSGTVIPWKNTKRLTNRLYFEERKGSVLGQNAFFGYEVFFDAGETSSKWKEDARIGIVPSECHAAAKDIGVGSGASATVATS